MSSTKGNDKIQYDGLQADSGIVTLVIIVGTILLFGLGVQVGQILAWFAQ